MLIIANYSDFCSEVLVIVYIKIFKCKIKKYSLLRYKLAKSVCIFIKYVYINENRTQTLRTEYNYDKVEDLKKKTTILNKTYQYDGNGNQTIERDSVLNEVKAYTYWCS